MFTFLRTYGRSRVLVFILLAFIGIFTIRLFTIQVLEHGKYKQAALAEQQAKFVLKAERGKIYAKDGNDVTPLVLNEPVYTVYADPSQVTDAEGVRTAITGITGDKAVKDLSGLSDKKKQYLVLAREVTRDQAEQIKAKQLAGIGETATSERVYPEGSLGAQLLGFVNGTGQGQYGIEQALDGRLKGTDGVLQTVTDVRNIPLTVSDDDISIPAQNGDDVVLTVDRNIQSYAETALKKGLDNVRATKGSVVVMDPTNGHIMAMANYPTYDPTHYGDVDDIGVWQNKTVTDPIEAGSVIKTLTMGTGLDTGAVTYNTTYNNTGCVQVEDRKICNVEEDPINPAATMTDVLHYSLNTGVVHILQQMGGGSVNSVARQKLYDYFYNHYRFGQTTGIEQSGEAEGTIIAPDKTEGNNVRYANMTFGQGMNTTMIQVTSAFCAAINGGTYYQPTLVDGTLGVGGRENRNSVKTLETNVLKPDVSKQLNEMVYQARQLGVFKGVDKAGYRVGGKTGTSQIIDPKTGEYSDSNSLGTYIGFGGNSSAKYVIMTYVEDSKAAGYAGTTAAGPIFNDISNWLLDYMRISPNQ